MTSARLDDSALLDSLDWDDPAASQRLARTLDPSARSLARQDAALLRLHRDRYGELLRCTGACPGCATDLEVELPVAELIPPAIPESSLRVMAEGIEAEFRLPSSEDVASATGERDLAERCLVGARRIADGSSVDASAIPAGVITAMDEAMAALHPASALTVDVTCSACGARWDAPLDAAAVVVARVRVDALRIVSEVHALARAYGWTEVEVLSVPRGRRRRYLELAGS